MDKSFVVPRRLRARDEGGLRIEVAVIEDAVPIVGAALHHGLDLGLAHHIGANDHTTILQFLEGLSPSPDGKRIRARGNQIDDAADSILTVGIGAADGGVADSSDLTNLPDKWVCI